MDKVWTHAAAQPGGFRNASRQITQQQGQRLAPTWLITDSRVMLEQEPASEGAFAPSRLGPRLIERALLAVLRRDAASAALPLPSGPTLGCWEAAEAGRLEAVPRERAEAAEAGRGPAAARSTGRGAGPSAVAVEAAAPCCNAAATWPSSTAPDAKGLGGVWRWARARATLEGPAGGGGCGSSGGGGTRPSPAAACAACAACWGTAPLLWLMWDRPGCLQSAQRRVPYRPAAARQPARAQGCVPSCRALLENVAAQQSCKTRSETQSRRKMGVIRGAVAHASPRCVAYKCNEGGLRSTGQLGAQ